MQEVKFEELEEKESYIVESNKNVKRPQIKEAQCKSEFEESFEFEHWQLMTIIKIEKPFYIIKSRHGRDFVKLSSKYRYLKPSKEFLKALQPKCEDDY
jgi:hypothetical protein